MEKEICDEILTIFKNLSQIPRKSGHEEKVSQYLYEEIKALNLTVVKDAFGNIIAEKPAAVGFEHLPVTILQAHMDMVCVAADGVDFNPLKDAIKVKCEDGYLFAEGTSLGADDGIGVAAILYLLKAKFNHGPLRAIFTVDEEDGMTGAKNLDEKYLQASYLINCDSEDVDLLTVSSAGSINVDFSRTLDLVKSNKNLALEVNVKGLLGGHSGMEINCGRANAIKVAGLFLEHLTQQGVAYDLIHICGGTARNSIPAYAKIQIAIDNKSEATVRQVQAEIKTYLKNVYAGIEKSTDIVVQKIDLPTQVMSAAMKEDLVTLINMMHTGVYAMSSSIKGLVESSANLGVIETTKDKILVKFFPRSSFNEVIENFKIVGNKLAKATNFNVEFSSQSPAWPENLHSRLANVLNDEFKKLANAPMKKESIHAGLECSWFYQKNKDLDMVSVGPTVTNVHSPKEKLQVDTLAVHVNVIKNALAKLV